MSDDTKVFPTWGYKGDDAQIFNLREGETLPAGWFDNPSQAKDVKAEPEKPKPPQEAETHHSELPENWRDLHHFKQIALAKALAPELAEGIASREDAIAAIEAYLNDQNG